MSNFTQHVIKRVNSFTPTELAEYMLAIAKNDDGAKLSVVIQIEMPGKELTMTEAAEFLGISKTSLNRKIAEGIVQCFKRGGKNLFDREHLEHVKENNLI